MKRREVEFWTFGVRPDKFLVATPMKSTHKDKELEG